MVLKIGDALGRGARRSASTSGIVLLVLTLAYQTAFVGAMNTIVVDLLPEDVRARAVSEVGFVLPVSLEVAATIGAIALLVGVGVFVVAARLLARDPASLSTLPVELFTRRMGRALLTAALISIVLAVVVPLGLALFVVPGLFLIVSFQFAMFAVAIDDDGPVAALKRSWGVASGNRWRLLALVVLLAVVTGVAGAVGSVFSLANPTVGQLASLTINSVMLVFMYGVLADAYVQLRDAPLFSGGRTRGTSDMEAL